MVKHANYNNEAWKANAPEEGFVLQRGKKKWRATDYDEYCDEMAKDGTYMGDLETRAFCNMRHVTLQVATDAIVSSDNSQPPMLEGFSPYHLVDEFPYIIRNEESLATYHIVHRGVGHYEPCIPYDQVCEKNQSS